MSVWRLVEIVMLASASHAVVASASPADDLQPEQPGIAIETGAFEPRLPINIFASCQSFATAPSGSHFNLISQVTGYPVVQ